MDTLSQLPLECLHIILEFLEQDDNPLSLATLLQTNRYFANVILPYLYQNPYKFSPYKTPDPLSSRDTRVKDPVIPHIPTRTLLNSLPHSVVIPKVLSLGIQTVIPSVPGSGDPSHTTAVATTTKSGPPSPLNYLAQVRHLHLQSWAIGVDQLWKWTQPPPGVESYILTQEFQDLCKAAHLVPSCEWSYFIRNWHGFNQNCFQVLFFREASWALAEPILEQLQSLTIPTSTLARYLDPSTVGRRIRKLERRLVSSPICRLRRLERIHFLLDRVAIRGVELERDIDMARRDEEMEFGSMVRFVQEHTRSFPGVLKTVTTSQSSLWTLRQQVYSCPEKTQLEINRILPAMVKPTSLGSLDILLRFLAHPEAIDLSRVAELDLTMLKDGDGRRMLNENRNIMQRCRALRKLKIDYTEEDIFRWAMDEQKFLEQLGYMAHIFRSHQDLQATTEWGEDVSGPSELWRKGLVLLEDIDINHWASASTKMLDDVVNAFSLTLKRLCAIDSLGSENSVAPSTHCYVGGTWVDLRVLTHLKLYTGARRLVIDRYLLTRCPNLSYVSIEDDIVEYNWRDVKTSLPARLPSLESLTLAGWPALTFHPETLHSTSQLKGLSITTCTYGDEGYPWDSISIFSNYYHYIPPIEDIYQSYGLQNDSAANPLTPVPEFIRPKWTWDWHLPHLVSLELSSEFAFLFQFHMLQGCPALQSLELEMRTPTSSHRRTITSVDMFAPYPSCDPIIATSLTKLCMHGPWKFIEPSMAASFLTGTFPSLESLSAIGWYGLSLPDFVQWIRGNPESRIKKLFLDSGYCCSTADMKRLRLIGKEEGAGYGLENVLSTVMIRNAQYFLLR